jgi:hypothetical protein
MYFNGTLGVDNTPRNPALNQVHHLFNNGFFFWIGAKYDPFGTPFPGKLAFIDVLEGVAALPTDFALSNGGVWTRKPYTGSYGTYGFRLDGSAGFNDVSGNGQHFTGVNMTAAANLDPADLPPFTV